jgi:hypothetical protein
MLLGLGLVLIALLTGWIAGRVALRRQMNVVNKALDDTIRTFHEFEQREVRAGRWHFCPLEKEVRPLSAAQCSRCGPKGTE